MPSMFSISDSERRGAGSQDFVIIGIAASSLLVLAASGHAYFEALRDLLVALSSTNSSLVIGLLLLNVALNLYGWRRYRDVRREVVERTAAEKRASSLASTDPLTGFLNRRPLAAAVDELLASAARRRRAVGMLIIDLDGFKTVNDSCGHARGDQLLAITARRLAGALRLPASVARWGGDEFVVLCDGVDRVEEVTAIASRLIASASQPIVDDGLQASVSMSVGIAVARPDGQDPYRLIDAADAAMYQAKRLGAGRWVLSSSDDQLQVPAG